MSTQLSTLRATWVPILGGLNEEELSCVVNVAIERLRNDFGQPYSLALDTNPSGTVQPGASAVTPAMVKAQRSSFAGKRWLRVVDKIDLTGKGGYAIVGDYTHISKLSQVPNGRIVVIAERQNGKQRVAVLRKVTGKTTDVFADGTLILSDVQRIAYANGASSGVDNSFIPGATGTTPKVPPQLAVDPWFIIIETLMRLQVPTT